MRIIVEKGEPRPEELAALMAVLHTRAAAAATARHDPTDHRSRALWRRLERVAGFDNPTTWRAD
jgi:hypothetical protein